MHGHSVCPHTRVCVWFFFDAPHLILGQRPIGQAVDQVLDRLEETATDFVIDAVNVEKGASSSITHI